MIVVWLLSAGALYAAAAVGWSLLYFGLYHAIVPPQQLILPVHFTPNGHGQLTAVAGIAEPPKGLAGRVSSTLLSQLFFTKKKLFSAIKTGDSGGNDDDDDDGDGNNKDDDNNSSCNCNNNSNCNNKNHCNNTYINNNTCNNSKYSPTCHSGNFWRKGLKYDISLTLQYADRPEVADLGGILFSATLQSSAAGAKPVTTTLSTWQALRYEVPLHRSVRHLLELPMALWRGGGSVAQERIFLARDLTLSALVPNTCKCSPDLIKITVDSLKIPVHSCSVQINGHLSGLAALLYYWRVAGAVVVVGGGTAVTWLLITAGLVVDLMVRLGAARRSERRRSRDDDHVTDDDSSTVSLADFEGLVDADSAGSAGSDTDTRPDTDVELITSSSPSDVDDTSNHDCNESLVVPEITLTTAADPKMFEGLRRRRNQNANDANDDDDDQDLLLNNNDSTDSESDNQSVPNVP